MADYLSRVRDQIKYEPLVGAPFPWVRTLANPTRVFSGPRRTLSSDTMEGPIYQYVTDFDDPRTNVRVVHKRIDAALKPEVLEKIVGHYEVFDRFQRGKPWVGQSLGYYFTEYPGVTDRYQIHLINEFIEGINLGKYYDDHWADRRKRSLDYLRQAMIYARDVFAMCEVMQREGIAHMDIKLDNIMIDRGTGNLVLIDFALFCITSDGNFSCRKSTSGTTGYMAPESYQLYPLEAVEGKSDAQIFKYTADVWSTSMIFLEFVTQTRYLEQTLDYFKYVREARNKLIKDDPVLAGSVTMLNWTANKLAMVELAAQANIDSLYEGFSTKTGADDYGFIRVLLEGLTFNAEDRPTGREMIEKLAAPYRRLMADL